MAKQRTDTEAVIKLVINGKQAEASLKELTDTQRRLNAEIRNMKPGDPGYDKMLKDLQAVSRATRDLRREQSDLGDGAKEFALSWKSIAAGIVGADVVGKGLELVTSALIKTKNALAEASMNRAVLTNALSGDAKAANESLKMLMNFAAKTPEGLQQATDGYLKLVNRGIKPAREEMVNLGDVAASQKKSMDQWIEAILDATTGENERLKEFGIQSKKNGDTVAFTFKGITKEVKNTEEAIYKALLSFGEMDGVRGTMDVMSKELNGISSNIDDTWDQIFTKLGQKSEGFIYGFYNTYSKVLSYINDELISTESEAEKLTNKFKEQASVVSSLEKNVSPLLDRYDALKAKGKLNKDEQAELKNVLNQVATAMPGVITQWDKYGNALDMNTGKAREFIKIQQAMLRAQNKQAVDAAQNEIALYTKMRDQALKKLNSGETTVLGGNGKEFKFKNTEKQIREYREEVQKYNEAISERTLLVKGLNGNYLDVQEKPPVEEQKSTARTEGVIKKEIKDLEDTKADLDTRSSAYRKTVDKIKALQDELARASGRATPAQNARESARKKTLAEFEKLNEEEKNLEMQRLDDQLTKNQEEIAQATRKYDTLIQKEQEFLLRENVTPEQKQDTEKSIAKLQTDKDEALRIIAVRHEKEMLDKIEALRAQFIKKHETELGKETMLINKFYDDQEALFKGNEEKLAQLKIEREQDLTNASLREKERLEKEKLAIEAQYDSLVGDKDARELEAIHKKYDDQILALKDKFSQELQATAEFQAALDAINGNREAEIETKTEEKEKVKREKAKETALESAQVVSDAVFQIAAANRQRETDIKLTALDKEREKELSQKNLSEKQKEVINKKYDEKEKKIKLDAWKADKQASIGQAVINGAIAVTKALPNIPLAIATGVAAAAQLAVIVAQKPPEFAVGVRNFKGGPAIVGEAGTEIVNENGELWLATEPTLANLAPGTDVYNATDTAGMLQAGSLKDRLYQPSSYSLDLDGARKAEQQYRSTSTPPPSYNSVSETKSGPAAAAGKLEQEVVDIKATLANFMERQSEINELPVNFYYNKWEEFDKNVKEIRISQGG